MYECVPAAGEAARLRGLVAPEATGLSALACIAVYVSVYTAYIWYEQSICSVYAVCIVCIAVYLRV